MALFAPSPQNPEKPLSCVVVSSLFTESTARPPKTDLSSSHAWFLRSLLIQKILFVVAMGSAASFGETKKILTRINHVLLAPRS
jgi:hypothetical protein